MVNYFLTKSTPQTKKLGKEFAQKILGTKQRKKCLVLAMEGELGSGKTTFLQGFAKGLGIKGKILSPTFVIMRKFEIRNSKSETNSKFKIKKFKTFYHIDCYRIKSPKEILNLGFKKIISDPQNIIAIEWADRVKSILPNPVIKVKFNFRNKYARKIIFSAPN